LCPAAAGHNAFRLGMIPHTIYSTDNCERKRSNPECRKSWIASLPQSGSLS
jgi:hypothetical protein